MKRGGRHTIEQLRGDTQPKGVHHDRRYRRIKIDTDCAAIDTRRMHASMPERSSARRAATTLPAATSSSPPAPTVADNATRRPPGYAGSDCIAIVH